MRFLSRKRRSTSGTRNIACPPKTALPSTKPWTTPTSASHARWRMSNMSPVREQWYERFVWALRRGAIPAGRVTSNAGALEHKPATSTINCTVSGTIGDSMDDILNKVHEAGLTLKAGCGIGYEFSTLRPRGAYVSGAGAYTSRPAVVHGYLRQDVFHRLVGRRPPRRADGHVRHRSSGRAWSSSAPSARTAACASSTCRC